MDPEVMKALITLTCVCVIAFVSYTFYNDYSLKKQQKEFAEFMKCRNFLREIKDYLQLVSYWDGKTHSEHTEKIRLDMGDLVADIHANYWQECGPIE